MKNGAERKAPNRFPDIWGKMMKISYVRIYSDVLNPRLMRMALFTRGASVILWLALFLYGKYRGRNAKTAEAQQAMTASQRTEDESEKQLLIPEYAMPTDVLAFSYYTKKGKPRRRGTLMAEYILFETQMFRGFRGEISNSARACSPFADARCGGRGY